MKTTTKLFLLLLLSITIGLSIAEAHELSIYPIWGYNAQDHICQVKQGSEDGTIDLNLSGDYWSIRECRYDNPEIIFYTGGGILIWFGIVLFAILLHYVVFPRLDKRTKAEKVLFFLQDMVAIGILLFFIVLLQHYFNIPRAVYDYQSDIDHIVYSTLIRAKYTPLNFAVGYTIISLLRVVFIYWKNKK